VIVLKINKLFQAYNQGTAMKNITKLMVLLLGSSLVISHNVLIGDPLIQQVNKSAYLITAPVGTGDFLSLNITDVSVRQRIGDMITKALEIVRGTGDSDFILTVDGRASSFLIMITLFPAAPVIVSAGCDFCRRAFKGALIAEDGDAIAFEKSNPPRNPINFLIIPKVHVVNYKDAQCTADIFMSQIAMAQKLARKLKDPRSVTLQVNNGSNAGQSVFHSHMHFTSHSAWK